MKCDLSAGEYQIIPYTTGCRFKQRSPNDHVREAKLVKKDKDDKIVITSAFRLVFNMIHLGSGTEVPCEKKKKKKKGGNKKCADS